MSVDFCHLLQIQLTRQHHHIGKLCIEAQGFHVADVELCAEAVSYTHLYDMPFTSDKLPARKLRGEAPNFFLQKMEK